MKNNKLDFIKIKNFYSTKYSVKMKKTKHGLGTISISKRHSW